MGPFLTMLLVLMLLVSTAAAQGKNTGKGGQCSSSCRLQQFKGCQGSSCGACLPGYSPGPNASAPCVYHCIVDNTQCITAHRGNCSRFLSGLCDDCVSGYVGEEGPAYPNSTCVKSNDPPAINDLITQILLAYDCTTATSDVATFKANLKAEFCAAMTQADCDRLVFGDPTCASSGASVSQAESIEVSAEVSSGISTEGLNTNVEMTVQASGAPDALSSKAILMGIDEDMADPTSVLMTGTLMATADTTTSLLSKATTVTKYACKGGKLTTNIATCPPRHTTTTLSVTVTTAVYGQAVPLTAVIGITAGAGANPVGKVIFKKNGLQIGNPVSVGVTKKASLLYKVTQIGANSISASYIEDDQFYGSNSAAKSITVARAWTKINVTSSKNPSTQGASISLTFTVVPTLTAITAIPAGKVKIFDGGVVLQVITLGQKGVGTLTVNNLSKGTHKITAQYLGNAYFKKSTTKTVLSQKVN